MNVEKVVSCSYTGYLLIDWLLILISTIWHLHSLFNKSLAQKELATRWWRRYITLYKNNTVSETIFYVCHSYMLVNNVIRGYNLWPHTCTCNSKCSYPVWENAHNYTQVAKVCVHHVINICSCHTSSIKL